VAALRFNWDPKKAKQNVEKHGVAFEEAEMTSTPCKSTIRTSRSGRSAF
jgi:uncharacterized DUF497 family protein